MRTRLTLAAVCLFGLEALLGEEIEDLGYNRTETMDGRVYFEADAEDIPRLNINLRFAERLLLVVGRFPAFTFDELFEGTKAIPWEDFLPRNAEFPVKGHAVRSQLFSVPDCQKIIKKAAATRMGEAYGLKTLPEDGDKYQIEFFLFKDNAAIMIDTSGEGLHKRGYRPVSTEAPLRETLAAAMVKLSRPREDVLFWDPMCGSGTIPTEACLMMTNTAPGLRRGFAAEKYGFIPKEAWQDARSEAIEAIRPTEFRAFASDIDPKAVEIAKETVRRAGMEKYCKVFQEDALNIRTEGRRGTIVCNPPYGERLLTVEECEKLYTAMGRHFATLDRWQIYIICSNEQFERFYGRRADKVRRLYNGMIKCGYYQFFKNDRK